MGDFCSGSVPSAVYRAATQSLTVAEGSRAY